MKEKKWIAATAVGAILAGVGIGGAVIPGSDGVIHGCYSNKTGALRVIDPASASCIAKTETAIQWNQTGPQGIQGPQGEPGPPGPTNGYVSASDPSGTNAVVLQAGSPYTVINSLALPAGKYLVTGKTVVDITSDASISRVDCFLDNGSFGTVAGGFDSSTVSVSGDHQDVLVVNSGVVLDQDGSVVIKCSATRARATLYRTVITALRVGDLQGAPSRSNQ